MNGQTDRRKHGWTDARLNHIRCQSCCNLQWGQTEEPDVSDSETHDHNTYNLAHVQPTNIMATIWVTQIIRDWFSLFCHTSALFCHLILHTTDFFIEFVIPCFHITELNLMTWCNTENNDVHSYIGNHGYCTNSSKRLCSSTYKLKVLLTGF